MSYHCSNTQSSQPFQGAMIPSLRCPHQSLRVTCSRSHRKYSAGQGFQSSRPAWKAVFNHHPPSPSQSLTGCGHQKTQSVQARLDRTAMPAPCVLGPLWVTLHRTADTVLPQLSLPVPLGSCPLPSSHTGPWPDIGHTPAVLLPGSYSLDAIGSPSQQSSPVTV